MKHLLYEHQNNITELKAEGSVSMKLAQKEHRTQETELRKDMRTLKVELKEQELANEVVVKNLRMVRCSQTDNHGAGDTLAAAWKKRAAETTERVRGLGGIGMQRRRESPRLACQRRRQEGAPD